jgi:hypothetical protein
MQNFCVRRIGSGFAILLLARWKNGELITFYAVHTNIAASRENTMLQHRSQLIITVFMFLVALLITRL